MPGAAREHRDGPHVSATAGGGGVSCADCNGGDRRFRGNVSRQCGAGTFPRKRAAAGFLELLPRNAFPLAAPRLLHCPGASSPRSFRMAVSWLRNPPYPHCPRWDEGRTFPRKRSAAGRPVSGRRWSRRGRTVHRRDGTPDSKAPGTRACTDAHPVHGRRRIPGPCERQMTLAGIMGMAHTGRRAVVNVS